MNAPVPIRMTWQCAGMTDRGRLRKANEDSLQLDDACRWIMVADGIGGHVGGKIASQTATAELSQWLDQNYAALNAAVTNRMPDLLQEATEFVNRRVIEEGVRQNLQGLGTTLVCAVFIGRNAWLLHLGDSRAYLLRNQRLRRLTRDHTTGQLLNDLRAARHTAPDTRHPPKGGMLIRCIGMEGLTQADILCVEIQPGDRLLLCSDGLTNMVPENGIAELLCTKSPGEGLCHALVEAALAGGGADNITVAVAEAQVEPPTPSPAV